MRGVLIVLGSFLLSALLWGLLTGRWSAQSRLRRNLQRDATRIPPLMRIPVPWVFMLTYLSGVGLQFILPMGIRSVEVQRIGRLAGFVVLGVGLVLAFSALRIFHKTSTTTIPFETPSNFVTSGPYRLSRNPMYLGLTLVYVGVDATRAEIWPLIVLPLLLVYINAVVIPVEERRLHEVLETPISSTEQGYGAGCSDAVYEVRRIQPRWSTDAQLHSLR